MVARIESFKTCEGKYLATFQVVVVTPDLSFSRLGIAVAPLHFSTGLAKTILNARTPRKLLGSLSTVVSEPRTATGSRMFPFSPHFCSSQRTGKALESC